MKIAHLVLVLVLAAGSAARTPAALASGGDTAPSDTSGGVLDTNSKESIKREMSRIGQDEVPGEREWQRHKSATVAMVSSMVLPGLGQLYNGRRIKTIIAVGVFGYYLGTAWFEQKDAQRSLKARDALDPDSFAWREEDAWYQFHRESAKDYLWWSGAVWLITVLDAFVDAHLYDVRAVEPAVVRDGDGTKYIGFSLGF